MTCHRIAETDMRGWIDCQSPRDASRPMDFDIFISHSSKDKSTADAACAMLEVAGIRCWIAPRDIAPGREYGAAIVDAIGHCRAMVLIFSADANASAQISREIEHAVRKGVTIVPVRIENVEPTKSMEYFLGSIHWLDALTPPLERHLQRLAQTLKAILQANSAPEAAPIDGEAARHAPSRATARSEAFAETNVAVLEADTAPKRSARRRWIAGAALALSVLVVAGAGLAYVFMLQPSQPLGSPFDGWTTQGGQILRYYPSNSAEACRSDCEHVGTGCFAYTWVKPGGYKPGDGPMCYLMQYYDGITKHPCCITANRGGTRPP